MATSTSIARFQADAASEKTFQEALATYVHISYSRTQFWRYYRVYDKASGQWVRANGAPEPFSREQEFAAGDHLLAVILAEGV